MVLPLYKVLSLVIRVFSKPLITYTKQAHLKNDAVGSSPMIRKAFVWLGNSYHRGETWVNRKFMKIETQFAYKPLNDELAIEKGLPLYEMIRGAEESAEKSKALEEKLKKIDDQLEQIREKEEEYKKLEEQISRMSQKSELKPEEQEKIEEPVVFELKQETPVILKEETSAQTELTELELPNHHPSHSESTNNGTTTISTEKLKEMKDKNLLIQTLKVDVDGKTHIYHFYYNPNDNKASNLI